MSNTDSGWRKRQIALDIKAENARKLGLDYERNKTVIEMAREAGMVYREFEDEFANANTDGVDLKTIEAFAALVRANALAQPEQEPVVCKHEWFRTGAMEPRECRCIKCGAWNTTSPQRTWVGLIRGVRVEGDSVVITVKGGNDAAREVCSELLNEMVRNGA